MTAVSHQKVQQHDSQSGKRFWHYNGRTRWNDRVTGGGLKLYKPCVWPHTVNQPLYRKHDDQFKLQCESLLHRGYCIFPRNT